MNKRLSFYKKIIEQFTGSLSLIKINTEQQKASFADYPSKYYFFEIAADNRNYRGEVCLLEVGFDIIDPMSESSEASPIHGVEDGSGKLASECFRLKNGSLAFVNNEKFYYLYKLIP